MRYGSLLLILVVVGVSGCKKSEPTGRDTMTQRQKDSAFGQSGLPGAQGIGKAQTAADSLEAQRKRLDSAAAKPDTSL